MKARRRSSRSLRLDPTMSRVLIFAHLPQAAPLLAFGSISLGVNEANRRCECMV